MIQCLNTKCFYYNSGKCALKEIKVSKSGKCMCVCQLIKKGKLTNDHK